ncbi:MAG: hypothetical protein FJ319_01340 [SAR202 cluster bacterium]|nr:hypothetical protein [SAR202 cluster bacterium]
MPDEMEATVSKPKAKAVPAQRTEAGMDWPRLRFALAMGVFAAALGAVTLLINFLTQAEFFQVPERLPLSHTLLFGVCGALPGFLMVAPAAYLMYGVKPVFRKGKREPRSLIAWITLGFTYAFFYSLLAGGVFLPIGQYMVLFLSSLYGVPNLVVKFIDLATADWYTLGILNSFKIVYTCLVAGAFFGPGAWVIDKFNTSADKKTAEYGTWAVVAVFSIIPLLLFAFSSESLLSKLG